MAARLLSVVSCVVVAHAWNHRTDVAPRLSTLAASQKRPQIAEIQHRSHLAAADTPSRHRALKRRHAIIGALLFIPAQALAGADCIKDCTTNCNRVSGGKNDAYCGVQCEDYCGQTDREDGLSGSVSSSKGYLGWSSPLRLGSTVEYGEDRPPTVSIIPKSLLPDASIAREK